MLWKALNVAIQYPRSLRQTQIVVESTVVITKYRPSNNLDHRSWILTSLRSTSQHRGKVSTYKSFQDTAARGATLTTHM
jgi:hypothetical protein